jgi:hypothetical protein
MGTVLERWTDANLGEVGVYMKGLPRNGPEETDEGQQYLYYAVIDCFQILYHSLFTNHCTIRRSIIWDSNINKPQRKKAKHTTAEDKATCGELVILQLRHELLRKPG